MNLPAIRRQSATLLIVALLAIVGLLVRRDQLTRRLLVRTVNDLLHEARHGA